MLRRNARVITPEDRKYGFDEGWAGSLPHNWRDPWHRRHHFARMDDSFRDFDEQFMRMERRMSAAFRDIGFPRWHSVLDELESELPEIVDEGDHKKYQVNLHVGDDFAPRDIRVKLKDRMMVVEAKSDHCSRDGSTRVRHEIQKRFTLPELVNVKEVRSVLEPNGTLHIEAPLPLPALEVPPQAVKKAAEIPVPSPSKSPKPKVVRDKLRYIL